MVQKIEGEGDRFRCDVYSATGKLLRSFDITAVPLWDVESVVRKAMVRGAKVAHLVQHPEGVLLGRRIAEVKPEALTAEGADSFRSRLLLGGKSW